MDPLGSTKPPSSFESIAVGYSFLIPAPVDIAFRECVDPTVHPALAFDSVSRATQ
jgi:hypothetical protein